MRNRSSLSFPCLIWYVPSHLPLCFTGAVLAFGPRVYSEVAASFSLTSMSSRNAHTALTPEYTDFPISHTSIPSGLNHSSSRLHSELDEASRPSIEDEGVISSRIHSWLDPALDIVQRNTGLLLFITSQLFATFMNLSVKILNNIDPPITPLEVCLSFVFCSSEWIGLTIFSL